MFLIPSAVPRKQSEPGPNSITSGWIRFDGDLARARETSAAKRFLERAAIQCHVERVVPQGGFESSAILVPESYSDQAAKILTEHETETLGDEPTKVKAHPRIQSKGKSPPVSSSTDPGPITSNIGSCQTPLGKG